MNMRSLLLGVLISIPLFSTPVRASQNPPGKVYQGGGYTLFRVGDIYKGCNAKKKCVEIDRITKKTPKLSTWKKNGYTYNLWYLGMYNGKPREHLIVVNPRGKVVMSVYLTLVEIFY